MNMPDLISGMNIERGRPSVVAHKGLLYAVGGEGSGVARGDRIEVSIQYR